MLKSHQKQTGKTHFLFILIAIVAIGSGLLVQTSSKPPAKLPEFKKTILLPATKSLGEVNFTDHLGKTFTQDNLRGKWTILFFAFTNCPDICPTTLHTLSQVKTSVSNADAWHNYQVAMITVDPERDDIEKLKSYVPYFDSEFIGLRASVDYTTQFAKNVGILFFKGEILADGGYDMDHGAALILVNPEGQYAGVITAPHSAKDISTDLIDLANFAGTSKPQSKSISTKTTPTSKAVKDVDTALNLSVNKAWIRPAPPNVGAMSAYFELSNNSEEDFTIVSASSPEFANAMIHQTSIKNGMAAMNEMNGLTVPAKMTVKLTPMGTHLMLMKPKKPLNKGDSATIILKTKNGQKISKVIEVKQGENN